MSDKLDKLFSETGPFSQVIEEYQPRKGQQEMASLVEDALLFNKHLVVEAPSGSGKTLAYLVPILSAGKKAIISTATQYLQNQLYDNDIQWVMHALGKRCSVVVFKGRSNYVCPYFLEKALNNELKLSKNSRLQLLGIWKNIRHLSPEQSSDLLASIDLPERQLATCSAEQCLGRHCPHVNICPLMRVRENAQTADLLVVNHSLLFSDLMLKRENLYSLLPPVDIIVVDEAHRLVEMTQSLVGQQMGSRQLKAFCHDAIDVVLRSAPDQKTIIDFFKHFDQVITKITRCIPGNREQQESIVNQLEQAILKITPWISQVAQRGPALLELDVRIQLLLKTLGNIQRSAGICYIDTTHDGFILKNIPLNVSEEVKALLKQRSIGWVFTSATLSVSGCAGSFLKFIGLSSGSFRQVSSPIDYTANAVLYTPRLPVDPNHSDYSWHLVQSASHLLAAVNGKVLFLFTSHEMLQKTANHLIRCSDRTLFVQGTLSNGQLISKFKHSENGVLLGTGSFWEGLDLSGVSLSAVVIDKLPFAPPGDPLVKLRSDYFMTNGIDSFHHYQLPEAVIRLRQGCGRLLRRLSDKGVIMLADPRLHTKSYGAVFIDSLPAMTRSDCLEPLLDFLNRSSTQAIDQI